MNFKKFLLLISSVTSVGVLASNGVLNISQNLTTNNPNNLTKINFTRMAGISGKIESFAFNNTGNILYAASNQYLYKSNDGQTFNKWLSFPGEIKSVVSAPDGTIYVGVYQQYRALIIIYTIEQDQFYPKYSITSRNLSSMAFDKEGSLYIATNEGVYIYPFSSNQLELIYGTTGAITSLKITENGLIYAGTAEGRIYKSFGGYPFTLIDQLKNGGITNITVANDQTVYVTNQSNQVYYMPTFFKDFSPYKKPLETTNSTIIAFGTGLLVGDTNGNIWKSLRGKNFNKMNKQTINPIENLVYNSFTFTIFATTTDGIYKNK